MFAIIVTEKGGKKQRLEFEEASITIGRVQGNHVVLTRGNVSKEHCRITHLGDEFRVEDLGSTNGTYINGRRISAVTPVTPSDKIYVGEFILSIEGVSAEESAARPIPVAAPPVPRPRIRVQPPAPASAGLPLPRPSSVPPPPPSEIVAPIPQTPPSQDAHHIHLLDYAAIEIKRIDRANLPCALDPGTAGQLRIVLRGLVDDLAARGKLGPTENPAQMLARAFLAMVDLGPLNRWLLEPEVSAIRLLGDGSARLRIAAGWISAPEAISREQLDNYLRCLGAALPGTEEGGIPGLVRYRLENGPLVVVQFPPVCPQTTAVIYKNLAFTGVSPGAALTDLPTKARNALQTALSARQRIAVVGEAAPFRLSVIAELVGLLPAGELVVTVEDLPLLGNVPAGHISLASGNADITVARIEGVHSLLTRAVDLNPEWIVTRSVRWGDVPELLAVSASRHGVIAELPAGGVREINRELAAGLLVGGTAVSPDQAAELLTAAFDCIIVAGCSDGGIPAIRQILVSNLVAGQWKPTVLHSV